MKRLSHTYVKSEFEKRGYTLISKVYNNSGEKLNYICPLGHEGSICWDSFKQGHGCAWCYGNAPNMFCDIKKEFEKEGYVLVSTKYSSAHGLLQCLCPSGHEWEVSWNSFRKGTRCPSCQGLTKYTFEQIKKIFEQEGYVIISKEYNNAFDYLEYICSKGHKKKTTWNSFQQGRRCSDCSREKVSIRQRHSIEHVRGVFESKGFVLIDDEYKNASSLLKCRCSEGHIISKTYNSIKSNRGCVVCFRLGRSRAEKEVTSFIRSVYPWGVIENTRKVIYPYELDIFIPEKNLAVEYCGLYWHSSACGRDNKYHINKMRRCTKKGIRLITIFEDEYLDDKDFVFGRLKTIINNKNAVFPKVEGNDKKLILSDLRWDGPRADEVYQKMGFVLKECVGPRSFLVKDKRTRSLLTSGRQYSTNVNKIWDCGYNIYSREY